MCAPAFFLKKVGLVYPGKSIKDEIFPIASQSKYLIYQGIKRYLSWSYFGRISKINNWLILILLNLYQNISTELAINFNSHMNFYKKSCFRKQI